MMVSPQEVRADLISRREIALIDLREEATFALEHPLFAAQMPLGRIEVEVLDRIPRRSTRIILYDNGEGLIGTATSRLSNLGYANVARLEGDLEGWKAAGYELFQDVNSYSKAFGELVESRRHTPSLTAQEVRDLIDSGENMVILDARRFDEYQAMSIPRGINVPGAELVLRARSIAPDPATRIVVNCAGRTRSLIGTQSLINAGLPNRIDALRNGTIGWTLAGLELDRGAERSFGEVTAAEMSLARKQTIDVAYRAGVRRIDALGLQSLLLESGRTTYCFDVRTAEEYALAHPRGFRNVPGGQLVQEIDMVAPVRGGRIVLFDDLGPRADMSASWLAQMGWDCYVLDTCPEGAAEAGPWQPTYPALPPCEEISAEMLRNMLETDGIGVIDLAPSKAYEKGHIPGAWFAIRDRMNLDASAIAIGNDLLITSPDGALAQLVAAQIMRTSACKVRTLAGGTAAWLKAGYPLETGLVRCASDVIDIYKRPYEGTNSSEAAMQAYLDWEFGLVDQLRHDGTHGFFVI